jgi:5-methylcytosine-specific restriction endonuclease McrA
MSNGLCTHCSNPATIGNYCERHWFGARASETARGTSGDAIRKLLINQNYTCPYSGDMLIPGKNASLDHKIPKSRGGTHTVANLQWITLVVNRAKSDLSDAEFIEMCRKVVSKRDTLNFMTKDSNDTAPSTK